MKNRQRTVILEADQLLTIAARLGAALRAEDDFTSRRRVAEQENKLSAKCYLDAAAKHSADEIDSLRDMLSLVKAKNLSGAAVHIVEAINRVAILFDDIPEDDRTDERDRELRTINRLLYSAFDVVDGVADRKFADIVTPDFASPHCNPWTPVDDRCDELKTMGRVS